MVYGYYMGHRKPSDVQVYILEFNQFKTIKQNAWNFVAFRQFVQSQFLNSYHFDCKNSLHPSSLHKISLLFNSISLPRKQNTFI